MSKKIISILSLILIVTFTFSGTALAATSDEWFVNYAKGVPEGSTNPVDYLSVGYYSGGYVAKCTRINGSTDRMVKITSSSAGGMNTVTITTTGTTPSWKMRSSTTGNVSFKVTASGNLSCASTGLIRINN